MHGHRAVGRPGVGRARAFWPSGVFSSSSFASVTLAWILPISVRMPVEVTTAIAAPLEIVVPENIMLSLPWMRTCRSLGYGVCA